MATRIKKLAFETKNDAGEILKLAVKLPSSDVLGESDIIESVTFNQAFKRGVPVETQLDQVIRDNGVWTDAMEAEFVDTLKKLNEKELLLRKGGIPQKKAFAVALEAIDHKGRLIELMMVKDEYRKLTCEGIAEKARNEFLVASTVFWDDEDKEELDGTLYFAIDGEPSPAVVREKLQAEDPEMNDILGKFFELRKGPVDKTREQENMSVAEKFLHKYRFVDEDGRFINKKGELVDSKGRRIDEEGYLLNDENQRVDHQGNPIEEVQFVEFLDDEDEDPEVAETPDPV